VTGASTPSSTGELLNVGVTRRQVSPVWLVLAGIGSVQVGAAVAKDLFGRIDPTAMVWLRLVTSAVVLVAFARPRVRGRTREDWTIVVAFGVTLGTMNWAIYQSFARIPLGLAVTIEFAGPLVLAVVMSRRAQDLIWVALAAVGVGLLGFQRTDADVAGIAFALLAAAAWAAYILLTAQTGRRWAGLDGLAMASVVATLLLSPFAIPQGDGALMDPEILLLGAMVGLLSSVIPYSVEMMALRRIKPGVFSILMSLEPAAAALAGMVILGEYLSAVEWLAVACVMVASVGATRSHAGLPEGGIGEPVPD
jgi:inner membrane transporter RhtA